MAWVPCRAPVNTEGMDLQAEGAGAVKAPQIADKLDSAIPAKSPGLKSLRGNLGFIAAERNGGGWAEDGFIEKQQVSARRGGRSKSALESSSHADTKALLDQWALFVGLDPHCGYPAHAPLKVVYEPTFMPASGPRGHGYSLRRFRWGGKQ